jgi:hypothetical protein
MELLKFKCNNCGRVYNATFEQYAFDELVCYCGNWYGFSIISVEETKDDKTNKF